MNPIQRAAFETEIAEAQRCFAGGQIDVGFRHLERAHVIGQAHVVPHVRTHWLMLKVEVRRRRPLAILGQAARVLLGALGSAIGVVPTGNTGGSDISMFRRLPIDPELQRIIAGQAPDDGRRHPGTG